MYETQIGLACLRCCDFCRRFETLFVCRGADDQKPSSVQILCRHPWCPTRVEMDENMGTISAVKCKVCFLGREAAIREAPAFANPGLLRPQRRFRREGNSVSPGLTSGGRGGLLAGWSVNLPMLWMFRKEKAPAGGLIQGGCEPGRGFRDGHAHSIPQPSSTRYSAKRRSPEKPGFSTRVLPSLGAQ